MEFSKKINQIKQTDIVNYLESLNIYPAKISNENYWYLSPIRNEKTPSFKVDRNKNLWFDFGLGKGGSLVDLILLYKQCTIAEIINNSTDVTLNKFPLYKIDHPIQDGFGKLQILSEQTIKSYALIDYLKARNIPLTIAQKYCSEITYQIGSKKFFAIGFRNDCGGYELRNKYIKLSSSPKGLTTIRNSEKNLAVFEGYFDFLSFITVTLTQPYATDYLILNSLAFFERTKDIVSRYSTVDLFLDNDLAGQNCSLAARRENAKFSDRSSLYSDYKDLNDWLINFGKERKQKLPGVGF